MLILSMGLPLRFVNYTFFYGIMLQGVYFEFFRWVNFIAVGDMFRSIQRRKFENYSQWHWYS